MMYSLVALSAIVAAVQAQANVAFTNSNYDVKPGVPFTLTYPADQCPSGCTITLKSGPAGNLQTVKVLDPNSTGGKKEVTLDTSLPAGKLAFEIKRNDGGQPNYSPQFDFAGTGAAITGSTPSTSSATATSASQSSASSGASSTMSLTSSRSSSSLTTSAPTSMISSLSNTTSLTSSARNMTTTSSSTTDSSSSTTSSRTDSVSTSTTIPGSGVDRASASWVVMAGAFAALVYLN
ncbi:hypothetical protein HIM_02344 [Hirsutella minnesotensis 3608]|nr:hypothetical protein HIM_02344 [Hirsutella minnesotensis 3608]